MKKYFLPILGTFIFLSEPVFSYDVPLENGGQCSEGCTKQLTEQACREHVCAGAEAGGVLKRYFRCAWYSNPNPRNKIPSCRVGRELYGTIQPADNNSCVA